MSGQSECDAGAGTGTPEGGEEPQEVRGLQKKRREGVGTSSLYATAAVEAVARSAVPQDTDVRVTRGLSVSP